MKGIDCGGQLGFFVFVAVVGYAVGGHVVATVLKMVRSRGGKQNIEAGGTGEGVAGKG